MTRADELWLAMTFWLVRNVHWSNSSQWVSHFAVLCHNLSLSGYRCVQHDMLRTKRDLTETQLGADSEPWYNGYVHRAKTNKQGSRNNQNWPHGNTARVAQTGRKTTKTPRRVSKRARPTSSDMGRMANLITLLDLCVSSQHYPNTVT